jgi:SpoVK/Ycf46/Vps4 family AAA+-type ATPase
LDIVGQHFTTEIDSILNGDANRIRVVNCSIINHSINVRLMNKPPLERSYPCQKVVVDYVIDKYRNKKSKNVTVMLSGAPGLGKSTVAFLITQKVKSEFGVDPYLIKGFNVNCEQMQYHPVIGHYDPKNSTPIVLLLDEFDIAMKNAEDGSNTEAGNEGQRTRPSLAISANKTNLNQFLDAMNDESFLIVVVTTNKTVQEMQQTYPVYSRKGRFDMLFQMTDQDTCNMINPV